MPARHHAGQSASLDGVNRVVIKALFSSVPTGQPDRLNSRPLESYLTEMYNAVLSPDARALIGVVQAMRRAQITSATIAEIYVPSLARKLGDAWLADALDFGGVTIGSARLQGLLWQLERDWTVPEKPPLNSPPAFLVGVPKGNQHTLGATILAGQLRHRGMSVNLDLELTPTSLGSHVINQQLSGVLLSVAPGDDLAFVERLVDSSHQQDRDTPVIIGGSILDLEDLAQAQTNADFVTSCVDEVLRFCDGTHADQLQPVAFGQGNSA